MQQSNIWRTYCGHVHITLDIHLYFVVFIKGAHNQKEAKLFDNLSKYIYQNNNKNKKLLSARIKN